MTVYIPGKLKASVCSCCCCLLLSSDSERLCLFQQPDAGEWKRVQSTELSGFLPINQLLISWSYLLRLISEATFISSVVSWKMKQIEMKPVNLSSRETFRVRTLWRAENESHKLFCLFIRAVKVSALIDAINLAAINALKYFNAVNATLFTSGVRCPLTRNRRVPT